MSEARGRVGPKGPGLVVIVQLSVTERTPIEVYMRVHAPCAHQQLPITNSTFHNLLVYSTLNGDQQESEEAQEEQGDATLTRHTSRDKATLSRCPKTAIARSRGTSRRRESRLAAATGGSAPRARYRRIVTTVIGFSGSKCARITNGAP